MDIGYKVLVYGISVKISKTDFIDIFLKYGDMLTIYIDERNVYDGQRSGYVVYRKKKECYRAISEINGQPPYYMSLRFASFVNESGENYSDRRFDDFERLPPHRSINGRGFNRGPMAMSRGLEGRREVRLRDNAFVYEEENASFRNCNSQLQRRNLMMNNQRISDVPAEMSRRNGQLFTRPVFGSLTPPVEKIVFFIKCKACGKASDKSCANCGVLYCSKLCQLEDWDKHKHECLQLKYGALKSSIAREVFGKNDNRYQDDANEEERVLEWQRLHNRIEEVGKQFRTMVDLVQVDEREEPIEDNVRRRQADEPFEEGCARSNRNFDKSDRFKLGDYYKDEDKKFAHACKCDNENIGVDHGEKWEDTKDENNDETVDQVTPGRNINFKEDSKHKIWESNSCKKKKSSMHTTSVSFEQKNNSNTSDKIKPEKDNNSANLPKNSSKLIQEQITVEIAKVHNSMLPSKSELENTYMPKSGTAPKLDSTSVPWNLLSNNPDTQIVNYDLCTQHKKLPSDKFTKVTISASVAAGEYWVHCESDLEDLRVIMSLMMDKGQPSGVPYKPIVGSCCSALFVKTVYRSKVLSVEESRAKVLFIDFGKIVYCEFKDMNEIPTVAKSYYAQAVHVKMDPRTPNEYLNLREDCSISVKPVGMSNEGLTKVQVKGELYAQEVPIPKLLSPSASMNDLNKNDANETQWPPSVLSLLKEGHKAACTVLSIQMNADEERDEIILAIAFEDVSKDLEKILFDLPKDCMKIPEDPNFNPSVGDLLAAYYDARDHWVRSIVLATGLNRWLVACCDFGVIVEVTKIKKIPEGKKYREAPSLSAKCSIVHSMLPRDDLFCDGRIKVDSSLYIQVGKRNGDHLECKLGIIEDQPFCTVALGIWAAEVNAPVTSINDGSNISQIPALEYVCLTSGSKVIIVSYFLSMVMYVQPFDLESKRQIEDLQKSISTYAEKSEPVKEMPEKGNIFICMFSGDMKYYRVVINKVKSPDEIHVKFIDFGNDEKVPLSRLYNLPSELEKIPCYGVKIELKKEFEKPLTKEAHGFLTSLILENTELTLTFPEGNLRNCELTMKNGSIVNNILERMIGPQLSKNKS